MQRGANGRTGIVIALLAVLLAGCAATLDRANYATWAIAPDATPASPADSATTINFQGIRLRSGLIVVSEQGSAIGLLLSLSMSEYHPYAHTGVIGIEKGRAYVYEAFGLVHPFLWGPPSDATGGTIRRVSLESYLRRQRIVAIYAPPPGVQIDRVADFARRAWRERVPFDPYFNTADHSKLYCSEFVALALVAGGDQRSRTVPITPNPSARVALEWLKVPLAEIIPTGLLVDDAPQIALLSQLYSPAQIATHFEVKRELHRRFTSDQRLANVFAWRTFGGLRTRPEILAFRQQALRHAWNNPGESPAERAVAVRRLADESLGAVPGER